MNSKNKAFAIDNAVASFMDKEIFEALPGFVLILGKNPLRVLAANRVFKRMIGVSHLADVELETVITFPRMPETVLEMMNLIDSGTVPAAQPAILTGSSELKFEILFSLLKQEKGFYLAACRVLETLGEVGGLCMAQIVYRSFPVPLCVKDFAGRVVGANLAFFKDMDRPMEAVLGKDNMDFFKPEQSRKLLEAEDEAKRIKGSVLVSDVPTSKAGQRLEVIKTPFFDKEGVYSGLISLGYDIKKSTRISSAATRRNKLLAAINDAAHTLLAGKDNFTTNLWRAQERIGKSAGVDRVYVWRNFCSPERKPFAECLGEWKAGDSCLEDTQPVKKLFNYGEEPSRFYHKLERGESIVCKASEAEQGPCSFLQNRGARSTMIAPIIYEHEFWGFIGFDDCKIEREWTEDEEIVLRIGGALIGAALAHAAFNAALQRSEKRFRDVAMASGKAIWELDRDDRISFVSERSNAVFGVDAHTLVGQKAAELGRIPNHAAALAWLAKLPEGSTMAGQESFHGMEHSYRDKSGTTRILRSSGVIQRTADGGYAGMRGASVDVTEDKEAKEQLSQALAALRFANEELSQYAANTQFLAEQAEAANKVKSEFLSNIGHEVRTPINVITGMAYLAMQTGLSEKQQEYIKKIKESGAALLGIMNNIIDYAQLEGDGLVLEILPLRVSEVFYTVASGLESQCQTKGLEYRYEVEPDVPELLRGDPSRLGQVLKILMHNALKFTEKGSIYMKCALDVDMHDRVRLCFSVADTGIGMTLAEQRRIFAPFSQGDGSAARRFGGAGVGLSLARRLVEAIGGELAIESERDKGTTASFFIDLKKADEVVPECSYGESLGRFSTDFANVAGAFAIAILDVDVTRRPFLDVFEELKFNNTVVNGLAEVEGMLRATNDGAVHYDIVAISMSKDNREEGKAIARALRLSGSFVGVPIVGVGPWTIQADEEMRELLDDILPPGVPTGPFKSIVAQWAFTGMQARLNREKNGKLPDGTSDMKESFSREELVDLMTLERLLLDDDGDALALAEKLGPALHAVDPEHSAAFLDAIRVFDFTGALKHKQILWQKLAEKGTPVPEDAGQF